MYKSVINIDEIEIPVEFKNSSPSKHKIKERITYYQVHKSFPKVIVREDTKRLLDGYASYIAAVELGLKKISATILPAKEAINYTANNWKERVDKKELNRRVKVMKEKGDTCYICHRKLYEKTEPGYDGTNELTIDHKIPIFKGGSNVMDNLFPCCNICNGLKSDFTYSEELVTLIRKELKDRKLI